MTTIRLATGVGPPDAFAKGMADEHNRPALLASYYYLDEFLRVRPRLKFRDWVLDSGAFSAHNSGAIIDLGGYIETSRCLLSEDDKLVEVYALDVIGDWRASLKNTERMWEAGVKAIPCFHYGEPWDVLVGLAQDYPKVAIGGVARMREAVKHRFVEQCFARIWPTQVHGFGMATESLVLGFPFHSVDASSWELGPCAFGQWRTFGKMSVRGSSQNLRAEVDWYLRLERKARSRWRNEMSKLDGTWGGVRLSMAASRYGREGNNT